MPKLVFEYTLYYQQAEIEAMEKQERQGGVQQHQRLTGALKKQIEQQKTRLEEV